MSEIIDKPLSFRNLRDSHQSHALRYFLMSMFVGLVAIAMFATQFIQINSQGRYAKVIDSGRQQRSLVQQAALFSSRLLQESGPQRRGELRAIIVRILSDLERLRHQAMQSDAMLDLTGATGDGSGAFHPTTPADLNRRLDVFADEVRAIVTRPHDASPDARSPELTSVLEAVPGNLLSASDDVIAASDRARRRAKQQLQVVEAGLVVLLLLGLYFELRYVFGPMSREIARGRRNQDAIRRRYDAVLETVGEAIITIDADNIILSANAETERVWGLPFEELEGRSIDTLFLPDRDPGPGGWRATIPPGQPAASFGVRRGGEVFPLELRLTGTARRDIDHDRAGASAADPGFFTLAARDMSERVAADRQVAAARDAALDSARGRSEFVASVSHELRTPMNGVLGAADLLEATGLTEGQQELLDTIRTSGDSLLAIINDILDFSKMEAGKMSLESIELDLRQLVESAADVLAGRALQKHLELIVYIEPGTPTQLLGDPARVRQVILNLLGNAIKFTNSGEIILRVHCDEAGEEAATLRFSVQDTGAGIDTASRARLFHAFSQADVSTARRFGGTGLGLTISRQLVELMEGEIGVDSVPGKGSTFWFTARFALNPAPDAALDRENPSLESLRGTRVLIVDDNATLRGLLQERLAAWDMVADTAEDAAHTLAMLGEKMQAGTPYDIALLDLNLGSIDGFTLAWAITNQPLLARTRLILVTSLGLESDRHACAQVGIRASVTKPLKYHNLLNTMAQVLAGADLPPAIGANGTAQEASREPKPIEPKNVRVLLVEDNAINRKLGLRQLNNLGYRADVVENGMEALAALDAATYDVVLLDMHMPVMDGCQAALTIRQHETQLGKRRQTLIALTASTSGGDREKCLSSGMDDFLGKPVRQDELAKTLARWVPDAHAQVAAKR